jgi:decaprenylphospho-beta-D-ribofuranose 2-oxidase
VRKEVANWGLYPIISSNVFEPHSYDEIIHFIKNNESIIARGNGKCYGDASLSKNIIATTSLNKIISFDEQNGIIQCQSGVLLSSILELIVPKGYFLPITPGTKFITIGGAFASDIHGKNHHIEGVFSDHVTEIKLINQKAELVKLSQNETLFIQTAGALGLTGVIVELTLRLKKIETSYIKQTSIKAKNLEEIFQLFEDYKNFTYSVAWIDCLAKGPSMGKSLLLLGEHAKREDIKNINDPLSIHKKVFLNIPFYLPSFTLNAYFIKVFNFLFYVKNISKVQTSFIHYDPYFYPLDKINNWNRIYGKKGFIQYQFVLPKEKSYEGISKILSILADNNLGSFLAVLKLFGKSHKNRYLEFPIEGYTLAVDIKIDDALWDVLDKLDVTVTELGGKIYLTKDARMLNDSFEKQYPNQIQAEKKFQSDQIIRLKNMYKDSFLIIGANSDIAKTTALKYINEHINGHLILAGRNTESLKQFVRDNNLETKSTVLFLDVTDLQSVKGFIEKMPCKPKWIMYAAGVLYNNEECINDIEKNKENIYVNYLAAVNIINAFIKDHNPNLERIIGISSIAGLRGRKSNYMYGSAKSGFHQYLFGLRQDLKDRGILVQAVTPGVVDTKMTAHINKPGIAVKPEIVANSIMKKNISFEIYPNLTWYIISKIAKYAPEFIISKL